MNIAFTFDRFIEAFENVDGFDNNISSENNEFASILFDSQDDDKNLCSTIQPIVLPYDDTDIAVIAKQQPTDQEGLSQVMMINQDLPSILPEQILELSATNESVNVEVNYPEDGVFNDDNHVLRLDITDKNLTSSDVEQGHKEGLIGDQVISVFDYPVQISQYDVPLKSVNSTNDKLLIEGLPLVVKHDKFVPVNNQKESVLYSKQEFQSTECKFNMEELDDSDHNLYSEEVYHTVPSDKHSYDKSNVQFTMLEQANKVPITPNSQIVSSDTGNPQLLISINNVVNDDAVIHYDDCVIKQNINNVLDQYREEIINALVKDGEKISFTLKPAELGKVSIEMNFEQNNIVINTEHEQVANILREHIYSLVSALQDIGFDNMDFDFSSDPRSHNRYYEQREYEAVVEEQEGISTHLLNLLV